MNSRIAGLFTGLPKADSYQLPHPPLGLPVILLICRVVLRAFEFVRQEKFDLAKATEDEVTAVLLSTIENNLRQNGSVPGFNRRIFEAVVRQGQFTNYDGTRLTKTPDLRFKLRDDSIEPRLVLSEYEGLFVECKPVDGNHPVGGKYCDEGVSRFVEGHYAWAMEEGMMLGYARNARTIATHLLPAMSHVQRTKQLKTLQLPDAVNHRGAAATVTSEHLHVSVHDRGFPWRDAKGIATPISIYHLWCECS